MMNDVTNGGDASAASNSRPVTGKRIILDTMLWNYVGDDGSVSTLLDAARSADWTFVHPPSILLEVLRSSDDQRRVARVTAMISSGGDRLASEAELCVNELLKAIRYYRPRWFLRQIDRRTVNVYHGLWTEKVWQDALNNSQEIHKWQNRLDPSIEHGRTRSQRLNKRFMERDNFDLKYTQVARSAPPYVRQFFGGTWDGNPVEAWRFDVGMIYWEVMIGRPGRDADTLRDWLESYLDARTATVDAEDFMRLWFDDLTVADVRRDWLRFAVNHTQTRFKIHDSNARDEQHSAYLVDADMFLSADRRLVNVLEIVREQAPFNLAEPRLVKPASRTARVEAIIASAEDQ
jgi:hypothetical protein